MSSQDQSNNLSQPRSTPNQDMQDNVSDCVQGPDHLEQEQQYQGLAQANSHLALQAHLQSNFSAPETQNNTSRANENEVFDSQKSTHRRRSDEQRNEMTPSDGLPRQANASIDTNSRYYGGSLENLNVDSKRDSHSPTKDRHKLPTFGEDEFDTAVTRQLNESPANKVKMTKLERLLEDHKKRRAKKIEDQSGSMASRVQGNGNHVSNNLHGLDCNTVIQEENGNGEEQGNQNQNQISGVYSSIKLDGIHQGFLESPQITSHEKRPASRTPESLFSHEKTGRFAESPINPELLINTSTFESARESKRKLENTPKREKQDKKLLSSPKSQKAIQEAEDQKAKNQKYIPKISENSHKIYQNSGRAKEDELIIQEIIASRLKLVESNKSTTQDGPGENEEVDSQQVQHPKRGNPLEKVCLSTSKTVESLVSTPKRTNKSIQFEKTGQSSRGSPTNKVKFESPFDGSPEKGNTMNSNWSSPGVYDAQRSERSKASPEKDLNTSKSKLNDSSSTINNIINGRGSPKKSSLKKTFQYLETFTAATGSSLLLSPKNVTSSTIVEHKKAHSLSNQNTEGSKAPKIPTTKEIKELATMTKQIYVKVVDTRPEAVLNSTSSPKSNSSPKNTQKPHISSELLRQLVQKADGILSPEELKQFDEVQRLEIMLYNLQQMQQANLISQAKVRKTSSPRVTINESTFTDKQSWNQYAGNINDCASERRSIRKKNEEQRLARYARSASPQPMEKVEPSQESLISSTQLRQQLYPEKELTDNSKAFQGTLIKSWEDVGLYERHMLWLSARNQKVDQLNLSIAQEGMKDCSFKPVFYSKRSNNGDNSQHLMANLSDRNPLDGNTSATNNVADRSSFFKDKSLHKEKKAIENYTDLFGLKKDYNLYKGELFLPNRSQLM